MSRFVLAVGFVSASVIFEAGGLTPACGQDQVITQMYGSGVHEFFAGDYQQALIDLSSAIDAGSRDPRAYYFRGLSNMRMGLQDEAFADFEQGATLEAGSPDRFYPVSRALERVQGQERLTLERSRAKARAAAYTVKLKRDESRYEQLRRAEAGVLREARPAPSVPAPPATPAPAAAAKKGPAKADDPFADGAEAPAKEPAAAAGDDPFAEGDNAPKAAPAEGAAPAEADPFAEGDAAADAEKMPEKKDAPAAEGDPFADDAAPDASPKDTGKEAPAEEKSAVKGAEEDDPFGK